VRNPLVAELLKPLLAYRVAAKDVLARDWVSEEAKNRDPDQQSVWRSPSRDGVR
jgi:hypothetical protein